MRSYRVRVYGGEARISVLCKLFPLMEDKKSLTSEDELAKIKGKASLQTALDYYITGLASSQSHFQQKILLQKPNKTQQVIQSLVINIQRETIVEETEKGRTKAQANYKDKEGRTGQMGKK
ncbi:hypothetical protein QJS10_CPB21g01174 [Acorus calamus]|uniref:Uncharacterized protein n=1 Tax=Acorus calamus TaxID=4465 RepID=A0AAV9C433_ACOCL|nr:hypothetical protein QJS10_CPB21g01174 [Acorus calamus]